MSKLIVFGSLNMDITIEADMLPQQGETIAGRNFMTNPGGKGGNQAVAAAKMGAATCMIASVGKDVFGDKLSEQLAAAGVDCSNIHIAEHTPTGVAMITCIDGDNRIILSHGANHALTAEDVEQALGKVGQPGDMFLTQFECDYESTISALHTAKKQGLYTVLNAAPAQHIADQAYQDIDLLIVNQTECAFLTNIHPQHVEDCEEAIAYFHSKGVDSIIITLGSEGSVTLEQDKLIHIPSYKMEQVIDTTAAGDAYIGALAYAMLKHQDLARSMEFATKAAALTITKRGAQQSIPTLSEIEHYFGEEFSHA
ncbi:ribokinase [Paenibacillus aquistagni]|uniref:Ribokinase n=1 Tax=Paenibacillus aquistagni TaxID=1852522 RepID=A0A1X7LFM3_9BACL|nr:ribokinase [Paenibacillus aquistagni]NMM55524.1 ribokinase [Paenibacillus aquistagni]SMG52304.1 ribokinase [Paenibacillus aquistagni]